MGLTWWRDVAACTRGSRRGEYAKAAFGLAPCTWPLSLERPVFRVSATHHERVVLPTMDSPCSSAGLALVFPGSRKGDPTLILSSTAGSFQLLGTRVFLQNSSGLRPNRLALGESRSSRSLGHAITRLRGKRTERLKMHQLCVYTELARARSQRVLA